MDIFSVISFLGGLTFFLFGMNVMSDNLEKLAGSKLESLLQRMTANPWRGLLLGTAITMAIQSSSATTVMLVGLVNSGIMQLSQTLEVIFGANIGTTITSWIFGLAGLESDTFLVKMMKPANFAPILAFIGIILRMVCKSDRKQTTGTIFIGFAVLISGMSLMSDAVEPLAESELFMNILVKFKNPLLGLLLGTAITAIIQSSSASVGILQALALTGSISVGLSIPIIMGQNIGTCITALLSSIGANTKAKRVGIIHLTINLLGTAVWLTVFCLIKYLVSPAILDEPVTAFGIALIHTIFNFATTLILMPVRKILIVIAEKVIPEKEVHTETTEEILFLDERLLITPTSALTACDNATNRMAELSHASVDLAISTLGTIETDNTADIAVDLDIIKNTEDETDVFEDKLGTYLVKLSAQALSEADAQVVTKLLHVIGDFERLGDHALNLAKAAKEISEKRMSFTPDATAELKNVSAALDEILENTMNAYINDDPVLAAEVEPLEQVIDRLIASIRTGHIARLQRGQCTIEAGFVLSDILTNYERISDHCSNIAVAVIEAKHSSFDTHKYLNEMKYSDADFKKKYAAYAEKYSV
ncbi:MAG: Na/Pi cotransporter family protein [Clostridia bacterium]|nr:Na/Pi cotransporter family protein [Clostridia bacterium]